MVVEVERSPVQQPQRRRFTVDEYYRMAEVGILKPDERVELIDGQILLKPETTPWRASTITTLNERMLARLGGKAWMRTRHPVRLDQFSEPEPDVALVRLDRDVRIPYGTAHPVPADVFLVIEVSDVRLEYDLGPKADLYARHGIPELWVVDRRGERFVVLREPSSSGFRTVRERGRGGSIAPLALPHIKLSVDEILG